MKKVRTDLQGKLRTAQTEKEKAEQDKILGKKEDEKGNETNVVFSYSRIYYDYIKILENRVSTFMIQHQKLFVNKIFRKLRITA